MTIARLAETLGAANSAAGNYDTAIAAPASTPNGLCAIILQTGSVADLVTSAAYGILAGAVPLTERRFVPMTGVGEACAVYLYWASGVAFPAGAQTFQVVRTGTNRMQVAVCPMTVAAGQQVSVDFDTSSVVPAGAANPSWNHTTVAAPTECYMGIVSGLQTMTTTQATNWLSIGTAVDTTSQGVGWARRTMNPAGNALPGWIAATAEDYAGASISFKEAPLPVAVAGRRRQRGLPHYRR